MFSIGSDNELKRNHWLKRTLESIPSGLTILDAGAGELKNASLCKHLKYTSQDLAEYTGEGDGEAFQTGVWNTSKIDIKSDICNIPVPDGSFDVVLCSEVLEHVPDPIRAINELDRILKVGGILIITAPFRSLTHFSPFHYCDGFNRYFYFSHLNNYELTDVIPNGNFFDSAAETIRLIPRISFKYSNRFLAIISAVLALPLYCMLVALRSLDRGSEAISCYGYLVRGQKIKTKDN